ncbi:putative copper-exporting P-type ATPase V [Corynebacterium occultum]|uniref:Putative copper-exporting P-type ATPase V n=1 Tax=Corynebacterium occultum TaxID=2675219 RepID=A0A6B8W628_9CORY|nr:HAD family hydrolase [Corynebacterium occultum]QGU06356.1 putative copper-exporting P-type ATPase V [Corynebacterium occultum]
MEREIPEQPRPLMLGDDSLDDALRRAHDAAKAAGVESDGPVDPEDHDSAEGPKVSFSFELAGLDDAPQIRGLEDRLNAVRGIQARIIYEPATAWVTAPAGYDPRVLEEFFASQGVSAHLSDVSLRRRAAAQLKSPSSGTTRRTRSRVDRKLLDRAKLAGRLGVAVAKEDKDEENAEVLFTARSLLTRSRLLVSLLFSLPVLLLSYVPAWQFPYWQWAALVCATPVVLWGAWPFHRAMLGGIRRGMSALDGASSVAILAAYLWSIMMLVFTAAGSPGWQSQPRWFAFRHAPLDAGELFLDVACGVTVLLLVGRALSKRSRAGLLEEISAHQPPLESEYEVFERHRGRGAASAVKLPVTELNEGDDVVVPAGRVIPVDGRVIGGTALVGPGLIAKEREPRQVKVSSAVHAGSAVLEGQLKIRVLRTGHRTQLALIRRWIDRATRRHHHSTYLSTRTASGLIPLAITVAVLNFGMWWLISGNLNAAFATSLSVLAGVAPVALALSTALAVRHGIEALARHGILLRDENVLRQLSSIDTVIFNRVGTLSEGKMSVETVVAERGENPELVLRVAGALAMESDHPVSRALVHAAREARDSGAGGDEIPHWIEVTHAGIGEDGQFTGLVTLPLKDAEGEISSRQVEATLWRPNNMSELRGRLAAAAVAGGTPLVVRWKGRDRGVITLHDSVKPDAASAVDDLEMMGVSTMMLSRDTYPVARRFADRIGISAVLAGIAPSRKPRTVRAVHTRGAKVAMVGDNSVTECLRVADVGVLVASDGTLEQLRQDDDSAVEVVVLREDVSAVPQLLRLARRIIRVIDRNITFSWAYNATVMVAAIAGVLHPMAATVLMLGASVLIETRSNQARRF